MTITRDGAEEAMATAIYLGEAGFADPDQKEVIKDTFGWSLSSASASAALDGLRAYLDAHGWQLVPKVATEEMTRRARG